MVGRDERVPGSEGQREPAPAAEGSGGAGKIRWSHVVVRAWSHVVVRGVEAGTVGWGSASSREAAEWMTTVQRE